MVGTTISHYKVLEKIGQGGMGEVFLAQDTTLDRKVALKFLPEELQQDSTARKRFLREAKSAAALDHPYICHIHEVGEVEGKSFISMEYLQGETLKDKLGKGPLPLKDALEKATEVAEALEEAHKQGIVHRDLKPSNIMLTPQGHVKVMDFGLAKRVTPVEGEEQEITTALTKDSSILGTVPYMSPEQLRGQSVDVRSDIFSFGVVLYEMLSGVHPFKKGGQMETANAIFSESAPPLSRYTEDIPVLLQHTVRKMLAKEPDRRYQLIHDVRTDLEDARDESEDVSKVPAQFGTRSSEETVRAPVAGPRAKLVWILTGVLFVVALALGGAYLLREPTPLDLIRFTVEVPATETFSWAGDPVVSPDGRRVVLLTQDASGEVLLFLRSLDSVSGEPVAGTEGASSPFWSPDGRFIAYFAQGKLKKIDLEGGPPQTLSDAGPGLGGTWNASGDIVFSPMNRGPLYHVTADGGMATPITELNSSRGENSHRNPQFLPDGVHFLYLARSGQPENRAVYVGSLGSPEVKRLLTVASNAMYSPDGYLLFVREGTLMAQTFDPQDLSLRGTAFPVAEGVDYSAPSAHGVFSVSADGRVLAYRSGGSAQRQLCWLDRSGQRLSSIGPPGEYIQQPQLSPDGKRVALSQPDLQTGNRDIWLMDLSRGIPLRFTFGASNEWSPIWSPDGRNILYQNDPKGVSDLYLKVATGTGEAELLFSSSDPKSPSDWSEDGQFIAYDGGGDLWLLPLEGDRKPIPMTQTAFDEYDGQFSPDGQWIAYTSDESGRFEVYVRSMPELSSKVTSRPERKWQISNNGGTDPRWRRDGSELFYLSPNNTLMVAEVTQRDPFEFAVPKALFNTEGVGAVVPYSRHIYDVAADGQRFLIVCPIEDANPPQVTIEVNWTAGLNR